MQEINLVLDISITAVGAVVIEGGVLKLAKQLLQDWIKHNPKYHFYASATLRQTKGSKSPALLSGLADQGPDMDRSIVDERRHMIRIHNAVQCKLPIIGIFHDKTWQLGSRILGEGGEPVQSVGVVLRVASARNNP